MNTASLVNPELTILLPLGVIATQLMKVEADLRFLSMKDTADTGDGNGTARQVAGHLERISETLDSIRALLASLEADIQPRTAGAAAKRKPDFERDD